MTDTDAFVREFNANGSAIVRAVLEPDFIAAAKRELAAAIEAEVRYHGTSDYKESDVRSYRRENKPDLLGG